MLKKLRSPVVLITMLVACTESADDALARRTNELLQDHLKGQTIQLVRLTAGATTKLPDLVSVDGTADGQCVSISFARSDFNDAFIHALFYSKDSKKLRQLPPFGEPGIEAILTPDRVVFNFYSGVVIRLVPHVEYQGGFTPFKSKEISGTVVQVSGTAVHAGLSVLPDALRGFLYLRVGKAIVSTDRKKEKTSELDAQFATAIASMSLTFMPTVIDQPVEPQSVACTAKAFRK